MVKNFCVLVRGEDKKIHAVSYWDTRFDEGHKIKTLCGVLVPVDGFNTGMCCDDPEVPFEFINTSSEVSDIECTECKDEYIVECAPFASTAASPASLTARQAKQRKQRVEALRAKTTERLSQRRDDEETVELRPPRYDDVYDQGIAWLDSLAGSVFTMSEFKTKSVCEYQDLLQQLRSSRQTGDLAREERVLDMMDVLWDGMTEDERLSSDNLPYQEEILMPQSIK